MSQVRADAVELRERVPRQDDLRRAPNILLIPGTSSVDHLRENLAAAQIVLPQDALAELDGIGADLAH